MGVVWFLRLYAVHTLFVKLRELCIFDLYFSLHM